jgi:hypothetical protein
MESDRFDALTRSVASRRSFVAKAGGGGLGALLLGALGLREEAAAATTCLLDVRLFVRVGPSAGFPLLPKQTNTGQLVGQLRLKISSKGDLAGSTFMISGGASFPVAGSVSAHQIGLRITLAKDQVLVLQGVGEGNATSCKGAIDGGLVGPREGDLGDWHADVVPTNQTPTPTATTAAVIAGQNGAPTPIPSSSEGTGGGSSSLPTETPPPDVGDSSAPVAPQTPTSTPIFPVCPECQTSEGFGTNPGSPCNPMPDGTSCSAGSCCGGYCYSLDSDPNHCGACNNTCQSGCCQSGTCCVQCASGQTDCGGTCVDLSSDPANCGACGNACSSDQTCTAGACKNKPLVCPPGQRNCGGVCTKLPNCP